MEKCRFLSIKEVCQIGQLALHTLNQPSDSPDLTALVCGDVDVPNKAGFNTGIVELGNTGEFRTVFVMDCTAANDVAQQESCDCFVPTKKISPAEWLENFSEG